MKTYKLRNVDPNDISEWIAEIETTFDTHFDDEAFAAVSTFGQFCDQIKSRLTPPHDGRCTYQMAFYRLRKAWEFAIETQQISPRTSLAKLLPGKSRINQVKRIKTNLGVKINILQPPVAVTTGLLLATLTSFAALFYNWPVALPALLLSLGGLQLPATYANSLAVSTVGELTRQLVWKNYMQCRPEAETINYDEIEHLLRDWASHTFALDKAELHREATFG